MKLKKLWSMTKPTTRKIKMKNGQTRTVQVKGHSNNISRTPKRK